MLVVTLNEKYALSENTDDYITNVFLVKIKFN